MTRTNRPVFPGDIRRMTALGERLRAARLRRRVSASEMANRAGVSRQTIARLEAGAATASLGLLTRILHILALDMDLDLIADNDDLGHRIQDSRTPRPRRAESQADTPQNRASDTMRGPVRQTLAPTEKPE